MIDNRCVLRVLGLALEGDERKGNAIHVHVLRFEEAGLGRKVKVIQGDALRLLPLLPGRFDFVFIDAAKEDYLDYVRSLEPKLVAGTVVVADNTGMYRKDVAPYLEHVRGSADYASREYEFDDDAMEVSLYRSPRT